MIFICKVIVSIAGIALISAGIMCFLASFFTREEIDEACKEQRPQPWYGDKNETI